jgi:hypothetical protein
MKILFPISLVFIVPIVLAEDKKPKTKWEILKAERLEKEALTLLTPAQRAQFDEEEALIRRDREAQNALRGEVRAAKKRKRDAVEEAKIRL